MANYLASPPLVVTYALTATVDIDFEIEPIGLGKDGKQIFFKDIWPSNEEIANVYHIKCAACCLICSRPHMNNAYCLLNFGDSVTKYH